MQLCKHPCMAHGWISLWPPHWIWTSGGENTHPEGEIGLLEDVRQSTIDANACFLTMNHADASYVGRLHFDHQGFCQQLCELLQLHYGRPIEEIGGLDIP